MLTPEIAGNEIKEKVVWVAVNGIASVRRVGDLGLNLGADKNSFLFNLRIYYFFVSKTLKGTCYISKQT